MKEKNLSFKALLLLDNASSHGKDLSHPNIQILFLPPNCTSLIQPLDQEIIHAFKAIYIRKMFDAIGDRLDSDNSNIIQVCKQYSILDCINIISAACKEVKTSTLNACWRTLLPQMVSNENTIPPENKQYPNIITAASRLTDTNTEDVQELFQNQSLSEEDLIQLAEECTTISDTSIHSVEDMNANSSADTDLNRIEKIIDSLKEAELTICENDPSITRNGKSRRELQVIILRYEEYLAEKKGK